MDVKRFAVKKVKEILRSFLKRKKGGRPTNLFIEPTNSCNLNCPFCIINRDVSYSDAAHDSMKRPRGFMEMPLFSKLIGEAKDFGTKNVYLEFFGEPFLSPHISEMMKLSSNGGFFTTIFTNGLVLKETHLPFIARHIDKIVLSVDGVSKETYERNRVRGDFGLVWENLLKLNSFCRGKRTKVVWQFIVMKNNEHEVNEATRLARIHNIHLVFKTFNPSLKGQVTTRKEYARGIKNKPCQSIYKQIGVLWNGDVVACCNDPEGLYVMGNIKTSTLSEVWESLTYRRHRESVASAVSEPEHEPTICKTCTSYK